MVHDRVIDPNTKEAALKALHGKRASMSGVRIISDSSNKLLDEVLIYLAKHNGGNRGQQNN